MTEFKTVPITQFNIAYDAFIKSKEDNTPDTPVGRHLQAALNAVWQASPAHDGEVVAWLHTVRDAKARDGDTDLALSFDDHSFPLDSIGWVSIKAQPLFTAPPRVVDVVSLSVEHAKFIADILENYEDCGPYGEGWQSAAMTEINAALKAALEQK